MKRLTTDNTNALAHRVAGDSLIYECPNCTYGEVLLTDLIELEDARCLECDTRYELRIQEVE